MTYGDIAKQFYDKIPNVEVDDWRPADPMFIPQLSSPIPNAILVWLKDGSKVIFISEEESERMTVEEAIEYFIKCNENVYNFEKQQIETICSRRAFEANELALKALGLTKSGLLKDCESCRAKFRKEDSNESI